MRFPATTALHTAYAATSYVVWRGGRRVVLRVGVRPPPLPWGGLRAAVFVTAWNPQGRRRTRAANARAQWRLLAALRAAGVRALPGEGLGDARDWPPERSVLAFGIGAICGAALGRRLRQNAVVAVRRDTPVRIVSLR